MVRPGKDDDTTIVVTFILRILAIRFNWKTEALVAPSP
jgi:hypothetical protein